MAKFFLCAGVILWAVGVGSLVWAWLNADDTYQLGDMSVFIGVLFMAAFTAFFAAYVLAQD